MSNSKFIKWILKHEEKLSAKWLKRTTWMLLFILIVAIPVYAGVGDISGVGDITIVNAASTKTDSVCTQAASDKANVEDVVAAVTSFYQSIFAVLALVMGLIVALAYLTIRAVSREKVQETVQREIMHYIDNDKRFSNYVEEEVEAGILDAFSEQDFVKQLEALEGRIRLLEQAPEEPEGENGDSGHVLGG
jgi:hypothetical protein